MTFMTKIVKFNKLFVKSDLQRKERDLKKKKEKKAYLSFVFINKVTVLRYLPGILSLDSDKPVTHKLEAWRLVPEVFVEIMPYS